jgi:polyisoprenoid-binding protein YceI
MNFFYIAALLLTLVTSSAQAAEIYITDPEHTFVSFSYKHLAYSIQTSRFDRVNGTITLNDPMDGGTIDVAIETGSVSTGSDTFNKLLRSENYFNSEKFPVAKFTSDKVVFNDQTITSLSGELTIKGITKPVNIEVSNFACSRNFITLKYMCGANASAKLNRSEFDLGKYVPFVGDEISLNIVIEASKE